MDNIKKLIIHNFGITQDEEIEPDGNSFYLKGENGTGKSSIIKAVHWGLQGNKSNIVNVITEGKDEVEVYLDTGSMLITRKMKRNGKPVLTITDREGVEFDSPQSMLNKIISPLTFDPNEWMFKPDKEQLESLKTLVDPDGIIAGMESEHKALFDKRTVAGREKDRTKAVFEKMGFHKDAPADMVSHADLLKDYEDAKGKHQHASDIDRFIVNETAELKELEIKISKIKDAIAMNVEGRKEMGELPDLESKKAALDNAESINEAVRANQSRDTASIAATNAYKAHAELETQVKAKKAAINKAVRESDMPVEGMTFGDDCILLDNRELKSCSTGEQIVASLKISMALNKGLRTIMIKDGSLLDADNRKLVMDFAKENGFQVIMEVVTGGKEVTIEIEGVD